MRILEDGTKELEHDGYIIRQVAGNHHVSISEPGFGTVFHANCTEDLDENGLLDIFDLYKTVDSQKQQYLSGIMQRKEPDESQISIEDLIDKVNEKSERGDSK